MRIEFAKVNGRSYYFVCGKRINADALLAVIDNLFGKEARCKMFSDLIVNGYAIVGEDPDDANATTIEQLNKRIAVLEKKVAKLDAPNIYMF